MAVLVGDEDGLGGRVGVLEGEVGVGADLAVGVVQLHDLDAVRVLFEERGDGQTVLLVTADAPVHGVDVPWRLVRIDLRPLLLLVRPVLGRVTARAHCSNRTAHSRLVNQRRIAAPECADGKQRKEQRAVVFFFIYIYIILPYFILSLLDNFNDKVYKIIYYIPI